MPVLCDEALRLTDGFAPVELARAKGATIVLAAPTGRAAKRLAELAGHEAATIHRLLALRPGGDPSFDADHPLDADLVVVDETSMVSASVASVKVKSLTVPAATGSRPVYAMRWPSATTKPD